MPKYEVTYIVPRYQEITKVMEAEHPDDAMKAAQKEIEAELEKECGGSPYLYGYKAFTLKSVDKL